MNTMLPGGGWSVRFTYRIPNEDDEGFREVRVTEPVVFWRIHGEVAEPWIEDWDRIAPIYDHHGFQAIEHLVEPRQHISVELDEKILTVELSSGRTVKCYLALASGGSSSEFAHLIVEGSEKHMFVPWATIASITVEPDE